MPGVFVAFVAAAALGAHGASLYADSTKGDDTVGRGIVAGVAPALATGSAAVIHGLAIENTTLPQVHYAYFEPADGVLDSGAPIWATASGS
jgi:hypothetical protein